MPYNYTPLRYPGGKSQLSNYISHILDVNNIKNGTYCEAFCGGAGVAINLLANNKVNHVVLNDLDISIYSIWNAVLQENERFINQINKTRINLEEWNKQHNIYNKLKNSDKYSFELAWAAFFLNRTNRSGIIEAGPIGGKLQQSKYKIDCRFNKDSLIKKVNLIHGFSDKIKLYNLDGIKFIKEIVADLEYNSFTFFDPPYYEQGKNLYKNALTDEYHDELSKVIQKLHSKYWIVTYDDVDKIKFLYKNSEGWKYNIHYTANEKRSENELLFKSPITVLESYERIVLQAL